MDESHRHNAILNKKYVSQDITYCWSRVSTRGCGDSSLGKLYGAQARGSEFSFSALTLKNLGLVVYACYPSARRTRICRVYEFSDKPLYQKQGNKRSARCLITHKRKKMSRDNISASTSWPLLTGTHTDMLALRHTRSRTFPRRLMFDHSLQLLLLFLETLEP